MIKSVILVSFLVYVMTLAVPCCCYPVISDVENIARPTRPKTFGSPDELRSYLDQLGQYLAVVSRPRFGKRKSASPILPIIAKPRTLQQYTDQQAAINNIYNRDDDDSYKSQFKPTAIRNAKDLYDILFSSHRENDINNRHQYYDVQPDTPNVDITMDAN
ncbi:Pancreatic hormone-like, conserved site,Pancreatic hormone-like [Cinara cedri]|uniref:Pancreatic hormone-like, conserved site,Pancreatic hormone-like n=1 Tax=Cinara cedri TaxID=506608 RepID=A0A5E4N2E3_9HEMI|nr:Pancreatic hormone-like, conserved site,Pancreatic hormone-like [Cinara cedri]